MRTSIGRWASSWTHISRARAVDTYLAQKLIQIHVTILKLAAHAALISPEDSRLQYLSKQLKSYWIARRAAHISMKFFPFLYVIFQLEWKSFSKIFPPFSLQRHTSLLCKDFLWFEQKSFIFFLFFAAGVEQQDSRIKKNEWKKLLVSRWKTFTCKIFNQNTVFRFFKERGWEKLWKQCR